MLSIYLKEIKSFLSSLAGYVVLLVFLLATGLLLWVLPETNILPNANILDYGYASMEQFFAVAPIVLIFLIPAITMKSFSEEYKTGTFDWLLTKPLRLEQLVIGKYLASVTLALIALIPTLLYLFTIHWLAIENSSLDTGGIIGSYISLLFLTASFTAIGTFCSSLTDNQIISFLIALIVCFAIYSGFEGISRIKAFSGGADYYLEMLGMDYHYSNMSRGIIDTRNVIYFLGIIILFIAATNFTLQRKRITS